MKTEQEIKNKIKQLEYDFCKSIDNDMNEIISGKINAWNWVLEEPEYKRTIFDLTKKDLCELFILLGYADDCLDPESLYIEKEINNNTLVLFISVPLYKTSLHGECIEVKNEFVINENLDMKRLIDGKIYPIYNQILFADTIRNMLSMEKSDAII